MTNNIPCIFTTCKWMRAGKAFRCFLALPETPLLAASLTALIDTKVVVYFVGDNGLEVTLDPAFIVDVAHTKGNKFSLIVETVYENQTHHGPSLIELINHNVAVTVRPEGGQTPVVLKRGTIGERTLKGLHIAFFKNPKFQEYMAELNGGTITDEYVCKVIFKGYMKVGSCTELMEEDCTRVRNEFATWVNGGSRA